MGIYFFVAELRVIMDLTPDSRQLVVCFTCLDRKNILTCLLSFCNLELAACIESDIIVSGDRGFLESIKAILCAVQNSNLDVHVSFPGQVVMIYNIVNLFRCCHLSRSSRATNRILAADTGLNWWWWIQMESLNLIGAADDGYPTKQ